MSEGKIEVITTRREEERGEDLLVTALWDMSLLEIHKFPRDNLWEIKRALLGGDELGDFPKKHVVKCLSLIMDLVAVNRSQRIIENANNYGVVLADVRSCQRVPRHDLTPLSCLEMLKEAAVEYAKKHQRILGAVAPFKQNILLFRILKQIKKMLETLGYPYSNENMNQVWAAILVQVLIFKEEPSHNNGSWSNGRRDSGISSWCSKKSLANEVVDFDFNNFPERVKLREPYWRAEGGRPRIHIRNRKIESLLRKVENGSLTVSAWRSRVDLEDFLTSDPGHPIEFGKETGKNGKDPFKFIVKDPMMIIAGAGRLMKPLHY